MANAESCLVFVVKGPNTVGKSHVISEATAFTEHSPSNPEPPPNTTVIENLRRVPSSPSTAPTFLQFLNSGLQEAGIFRGLHLDVHCVPYEGAIRAAKRFNLLWQRDSRLSRAKKDPYARKKLVPAEENALPGNQSNEEYRLINLGFFQIAVRQSINSGAHVVFVEAPGDNERGTEVITSLAQRSGIFTDAKPYKIKLAHLTADKRLLARNWDIRRALPFVPPGELVEYFRSHGIIYHQGSYQVAGGLEKAIGVYNFWDNLRILKLLQKLDVPLWVARRLKRDDAFEKDPNFKALCDERYITPAYFRQLGLTEEDTFIGRNRIQNDWVEFFQDAMEAHNVYNRPFMPDRFENRIPEQTGYLDYSQTPGRAVNLADLEAYLQAQRP